jgi:membrane protease YdiL (CAAX protease family)
LYQSPKNTNLIATFLVLTFALSLPFYLIAASTDDLPILLLVALGLAPLITRFVCQRNVRDLGWRLMNTDAQRRWWHWENSSYMALSYALPLLIGILVYGITWSVVPGSLSTEGGVTKVLVAFVSAATVGLLFVAVLSIGEEVASRGFLLRELTKRIGFPTASVVGGLV